MASPTQRTLSRLRKDGWTCAVVEHWNPYAKVRQDLFGFIDVLAIRPGETLGVQSTTDAHIAERRKKAAKGLLPEWLAAGNRFEVWGWRKGKRGAGAVRIAAAGMGEGLV